MEGQWQGRRIRIGSESFCGELAGPTLATAAPKASCTPVFLADERGWLAAFTLQDTLRPEASGLVNALRGRGLRLHLLSGDHPDAVAAVAAHLGIVDVVAGVLPQDKLAYVERLQGAGRVVAMIGDGLNDAPVLARADVSFAMGGGADLSQRQADFVLTGDSLAEVAATFSLARRAMRIVKQNFGWALAYNGLALPLAATGWIGPWEAAVGMAASSFIVVLNALRVGAAASESKTWKASTSSSPSPSPSYS